MGSRAPRYVPLPSPLPRRAWRRVYRPQELTSASHRSLLLPCPLQIDQDKRFSDKEAKLLRTTKFPAEFGQKVDIRKVNLAVMRPWMVKEVTTLIGFEDEVVVEYAVSRIQGARADASGLVKSRDGELTTLGRFLRLVQMGLLEDPANVVSTPSRLMHARRALARSSDAARC